MLDTLFETDKWNMARKYVIRRRVFFTLVAIAFVAVAWFIAGNVWWTDNGYCIGSLEECFPKEFGGK